MSERRLLEIARQIYSSMRAAEEELRSAARDGRTSTAWKQHGFAEGCDYALARLARILDIDPADFKSQLKARHDARKGAAC